MSKVGAIIAGIFILLVLTSGAYAANTNKTNYTAEAVTFNYKVNAFLEKPIILPEGVQKISRVLFGLKNNDNIEFAEFVIMLGFWIWAFITILNILVMLPFLNQGFSRWAGAIVIVLLISISGAFIDVSRWLLFMLDINIFAKFLIIKLLLAILIVGLVLFGTNSALTKIFNSLKLEEARIKGQKVGESSTLISKQGKTFRKAYDN